MAEQEKKDQGKKQEKISFEEAFRRASKSLMEGKSFMDSDDLIGNLPEKMPDRFKKK